MTVANLARGSIVMLELSIRAQIYQGVGLPHTPHRLGQNRWQYPTQRAPESRDGSLHFT